MVEQLTDEEQVEQLKKWWKENGPAIVIGIVIGIGAIIGFWTWKKHTEQRAEAASLQYDQFITEITAKKTDELAKSFSVLKNDFEGTSYASLAALKFAAYEYEQKNIDKTIEYLTWAKDHPGHDSIYHIAQIRLAKVFLSQDKYDQAFKLIEGIKEPAFDAQYAAIRGDVYLQRKDTENARKEFTTALKSEHITGKYREYIQMKLDSLGQSAFVTSMDDKK